MIIIGEKINGSIPSVAKAIAERDSEFIKERARKQAAANATYIDCCASVPEAEEVETLKWMIDCIQEVTDLPISVDSPSADVLTQAYKFCKRPGIFNSVSGEGDKIDKIFPLMAQEENKDWQVIALLSDDTGIPKCAADRLRVFDKIMTKAKEYHISPNRIHIDPLVEMLCTSEDGIAMNIEVIQTVRKQYPSIQPPIQYKNNISVFFFQPSKFHFLWNQKASFVSNVCLLYYTIFQKKDNTFIFFLFLLLPSISTFSISTLFILISILPPLAGGTNSNENVPTIYVVL